MRLLAGSPACAGYATLLWALCLLVATHVQPALAKKDGPEISKQKFDHRITVPYYFDDSDVLLVLDGQERIVHRSTDAGKTWNPIAEDTHGRIHEIFLHPHDPKRAYILSSANEHWLTDDQGESWRKFDTAAFPSPWRQPFEFHADDSDKIIFQAQACRGLFDCDEVTLYTEDNFKSDAKLLRQGSRGCRWARTTNEFTTGDEKVDATRILCLVRGSTSLFSHDNRLLISDDYFEHDYEPELLPGRTLKGLVNTAIVHKYCVAAVVSDGTDEMALYVTLDLKTWHRAEFLSDHRLEQGAYTLLESTPYSVQLDVQSGRRMSGIGNLFSSNSNGTYFKVNIEHTNRNERGLVDFEKVVGVQGVVLVNTVQNWEKVERGSAEKEIETFISFDDGMSFDHLRAHKKDLHLHSVTNLHNLGRVFSSPAPGILMGVGNTGDHIKQYDKGDLYVSDDAGVTWRRALKGAHKYEFGDQGAILVAIDDEGPTSKIKYSIDHGNKWDEVDLGEKVRAEILTTTPDSTSLKFTLIGTRGGKDSEETFLFAMDFAGLHEDKCRDKDFETWHARVDDKGEPTCIMGQKQSYRRRKADADCFVDEEFKDPEPKFEPCPCTKEDYECDYNFERVDGECKPAGSMVIPEGECKKPEDTYMGSSGYQLIAGNNCDQKKGEKLDEDVERKCEDVYKPPKNKEISSKANEFKADSIAGYYYLERVLSSKGDDETIIMMLSDGKLAPIKVHKSHDHGKKWEPVLEKEHVVAVYPHAYFNDVVFFITDSKTVYYSMNRGVKIEKFEAPLQPSKDAQILRFHPTEKDWLIWTGEDGCDDKNTECHSVSYVSEDRGDSWKLLMRYVRKCQFVTTPGQHRDGKPDSADRNKKLVYCEQYENENKKNALQLYTSDNFFEDHSEPSFTDIVDFATMSEYIIIAAKDKENNSLRVEASIDGDTFAEAHFPPNFDVPHQRGYTVLDSSTHSVFLHVTVNEKQGSEYGSIIKSNSNGTSYVMSVESVNRNRRGYVDFEKMQGLEGVAMINQVSNVDEVTDGKAKKLKTMITHNDGGEWDYLNPPQKDADGNSWDCSVGSDSCRLHLHGYTERKDPRDTFSSPSAVGLMMGVGNVGESLGPYQSGDTFLTRDGGITWDAVKKGHYLWEYGDQGSIIVMVEESTRKKAAPVQKISYSRDEGKTWTDYQFSEKDMYIEEITTVPSDVSKQFLLWGQYAEGPSQVVTVNLDFSTISDRECDLNETDPTGGDYYLWEPKHPAMDENCLFGHVSQYHRKRAEADCFNGPEIPRLHSIARNCSCTRQDFECDYNFQLQNDRTCGLVPGLDPSDHSKVCSDNPDTVEYYEPTGYRRIPLTTCEGGQELEYIESHAKPCPKHEEEFQEVHRGLTGGALFFAIVLPFAAAGGIGYYVWRNWDGKFGRIRLGEHGSGGTFDTENAWIKYPIAAIAVVVAVVSAIPDMAGRLFRSLSGRFGGLGGTRYTTRSSFARGRGAYAVIDEDEGELLGDDSDEEV